MTLDLQEIRNRAMIYGGTHSAHDVRDLCAEVERLREALKVLLAAQHGSLNAKHYAKAKAEAALGRLSD